MIVCRSVEDKNVPPKKGNIRAENILGGNVLTNLGKNKTKVITISQTDLKGNLPTSLVNKVTGKGFGMWYTNIKKGMDSYQKRIGYNK